jgi:hypothetical protein
MTIQNRFDNSFSTTPIYKFLNYARAVPNLPDLTFLKALLDNNFINDNYYQKEIRETIEEIRTSLNK